MTFTTVSESRHLDEILKLQKRNLRFGRTEEDIRREGFVTCEHNLDLLSEMNSPYPHVIAIEKERVVAYALTLLSTMRNSIAVLEPIFEIIDKLSLESNTNSMDCYFVMGQVCIDKAFRGQKIFYGLYNHMKAVMSPHFKICITEISSYNKRSLKAHANQGFKTVHKYISSDGHPWEIVAWDWS